VVLGEIYGFLNYQIALFFAMRGHDDELHRNRDLGRSPEILGRNNFDRLHELIDALWNAAQGVEKQAK
jgi:hypothetical protein